jgi:diguanylate cyclase (GGDEF)-like protein
VPKAPSFTVSIGVAEVTPARTATSQVMHAADHALYAAKQSGRDRVLVAAPDLAPVAVA